MGDTWYEVRPGSRFQVPSSESLVASRGSRVIDKEAELPKMAGATCGWVTQYPIPNTPGQRPGYGFTHSLMVP